MRDGSRYLKLSHATALPDLAYNASRHRVLETLRVSDHSNPIPDFNVPRVPKAQRRRGKVRDYEDSDVDARVVRGDAGDRMAGPISCAHRNALRAGYDVKAGHHTASRRDESSTKRFWRFNDHDACGSATGNFAGREPWFFTNFGRLSRRCRVCSGRRSRLVFTRYRGKT